MTLNFPSSDHELVEAVVASEEALLVVYGHIQLTGEVYSCNFKNELEKLYKFSDFILFLFSGFTCSLLMLQIEILLKTADP